MAEVQALIRVAHRLVDAGNSAVVIENDAIADADRICDLGPEGGDTGGRIAAEGPPEALARVKSGAHTAELLREFVVWRGGQEYLPWAMNRATSFAGGFCFAPSLAPGGALLAPWPKVAWRPASGQEP